VRDLARPSTVGSSGLDDPGAIVEAYRHPLRGRVLSVLAERPGVTVRQIAERLDEPPRRVRHHLEVLVEAGLVEVTAEEKTAGAVRRRYGRGPVELSAEAAVDPAGRIELGKATVRMLMGDLNVAAAAGTLCARPDDFEARFYGEVDEVSFRELVALHSEAYRQILRTVQDGKDRVRQSGRWGTEIIASLFFFEAPLWGPQAPRRSGRAFVGRPVRHDPQALAKAYVHPVRGRVLTALAERPGVTIRELADHLGEPKRRIRHQVEALVETGLVGVTGEVLSRVVERRYGAGLLEVEDAYSWSREERVVFANGTVRTLAADFAAAAAAETFARGGNDFEVRMYGEVDDTCLEVLAGLHHAIYGSIRAKIEEGQERVSASGEPGTEVVSALFCFEAPLWRGVVEAARGQETA
jgi:DNA-binding transcriptional ArsR family regulator